MTRGYMYINLTIPCTLPLMAMPIFVKLNVVSIVKSNSAKLMHSTLCHRIFTFDILNKVLYLTKALCSKPASSIIIFIILKGTSTCNFKHHANTVPAGT